MAQVHLKQRSSMKLIVIAVTAAAVAAVVMWLSRASSGDDAGGVGRVMPGASQPMRAQPVGRTLTAAQIEAEAKVLQERQHEVIQELDKQPGLASLVGPVRERPSFVSELEWQMLRGVSQQSGDPERELTRLVSFLRFNKQLELWEVLSQSPDRARRQALADHLVAELPTRITNGEMDVKEARRVLMGLVNDVEPDTQGRAKRLAAETARLVAAADAVAVASRAH